MIAVQESPKPCSIGAVLFQLNADVVIHRQAHFFDLIPSSMVAYHIIHAITVASVRGEYVVRDHV